MPFLSLSEVFLLQLRERGRSAVGFIASPGVRGDFLNLDQVAFSIVSVITSTVPSVPVTSSVKVALYVPDPVRAIS